MNLEEASKCFQTIADPNRLTILNLLTKELHMCASDFLGKVSCKQATLSHHLSELVNVGLLNSKKKGTKVIYSLNAAKYDQLIAFLGKINRINKNEVKENPIRVVDSKLIKDEKEKEEKLPTFLL